MPKQSFTRIVLAASMSVIVLLTANAFAQANPSTVNQRLEQAVSQGSLQELRKLRDEISTLQGPDRDYMLTYTDWRIAQAMEEKDKRERKNLLEDTQDMLDEAIETNPGNAEMMALKGSVIGDRIDGAFSAMRLGPKASKNIEAAIELAPDNPRVALHQGISFYFTPGAFGGGLDKARAEIERAIGLFEQESSAGWPSWGLVDALAYHGLILTELEENELAAAAIENALQISPDDARVKRIKEMISEL